MSCLINMRHHLADLQKHSLPEDLHAGLGVGIERRLEAQLGQPQALEEQVQRANQIAQRYAPIADDAWRTRANPSAAHRNKLSKLTSTMAQVPCCVVAAILAILP